MGHVVLLGDSIFDNARYVPEGLPVVEQLRSRLPEGWQATLLARDGAIVEDIATQLGEVSEDATHLVVSAGGNNALERAHILRGPSQPAAELFHELAVIQHQFRTEFRSMVTAVLALRRPTLVCTVYDAVPGLEQEAVTALSIFNDVIVHEASRAGLPILDLRLVCNEPRDYSGVSPIEPSERGGAKVVRGIVRTLLSHDFSRPDSVIYGRVID